MINFDYYINEIAFNEHKTGHNKNWPYTRPYRILIIGGSGYGKTNVLLNLKENQRDIDKIYLYAKDQYEAKYQYLINKREIMGINSLTILKPLLNIQMICTMFTKILQIYYNLDKENKILMI